MKLKTALFAAALTLFCAGASSAGTLTLDDCLATAMKNNPDITAARESLNAERTTINQAAAPGRPQLSANSSYRRSGTGDDHEGSYSTGVSVNQSISDWGRRETRIKRARLSTEAAEADYEETVDLVVQRVYNAYYALNRAVRDVDIAQTRYDNYEKRLDWARSYYEVGTKAKIEVTKAESDLASSKLTLVRAQSNEELRRAELANAMGVPLMEISGVEDMLGYEDWSISLDDAVAGAMKDRPELVARRLRVESAAENVTLQMKGLSPSLSASAGRLRVESAAENVTLQMKGLSPSLSASAGYSFGNHSYFDHDQWNAGLTLSVPLTDGGLTKSMVEQARAQLRQAEAELVGLENSVTLEVRTAWEDLRQAKESLTSSQEAERAAKATLDLALGRYKAGVGDNLEISDAVDGYAVASANTVLALYDCKNARINLEKAMGGLSYGEQTAD